MRQSLLAAALVLALTACGGDPATESAVAASEAAPSTEAATHEADTHGAAGGDHAATAHVGLMAHEPWSRALAPGATVAAGYMHLMNHTQQPETLVGASAEGVGRVEIHDMVEVDGVMQMRPVEGGVPLVVDGMAAFQPGGKHLMFIDVTRSWNAGDRIPVSLRFESGAEAVITFEVRGADAAGEGDEHDHADHSGH